MTEATTDAETRLCMHEKLSWMERSLQRMQSNLGRHEEVQDHFLSFVHASHLLWFYFARWAKQPAIGKMPREAIGRYVASMLPDAREAWDFLDRVRTEDVHTKPVKLIGTEHPTPLLINGLALQIDGHDLMIGEYRYEVEFDGKVFDALLVCAKVLDLKKQFSFEFEFI